MTDDKLNQYLTFTVAGEQYAINVANIREVLEFDSVTVIPKMPEYMKGIINLRGSVVPVLDLKAKFGIGKIEKATDTSVIVTEMTLNNEAVVIGLLCDAVSEVIDLEDDQIEPTPYMGTQVQAEFIRGMGKKDDKFIIILDLTKVLTHQDLKNVANQSE
ncbi:MULTISPECIES: chemotaxis protein CheW [unclassified Oceanispirochaeta]|uniref:chemotaxis protein CheW n=1 Tax=unclassified Oceanispirochaeta TaxID=2635722 RepID=UPI000E0965F8|nr:MULTISPECIES: chemotaxis protein CheW [unclassified Oceanispirochaeta]MBF9016786.1 chemotaxis protein CheW [Oceanispirochaeta sp. M2]NPD72056.1 chemotaxis protein CheW [Oceanispirochaeta sp. M1]RDG32500.1 chemotaxis protein CheW [Oceanispirochaeta sp. M1]